MEWKLKIVFVALASAAGWAQLGALLAAFGAFLAAFLAGLAHVGEGIADFCAEQNVKERVALALAVWFVCVVNLIAVLLWSLRCRTRSLDDTVWSMSETQDVEQMENLQPSTFEGAGAPAASTQRY